MRLTTQATCGRGGQVSMGIGKQLLHGAGYSVKECGTMADVAEEGGFGLSFGQRFGPPLFLVCTGVRDSGGDLTCQRVRKPR